MKRITIISQGIILLALIPVGVALSQPRPVEPVQATVTQPEVVSPVEAAQVVEQTPIEVPVVEQTQQPIVQEQIVQEEKTYAPPATAAMVRDVLSSYGYTHHSPMHIIAYKMSNRFPERFKVDTYQASLSQMHSVFSVIPESQWVETFNSFTF